MLSASFEREYRLRAENSIFTPSLIYYRHLLKKNLVEMIRVAGSAERLWPHVKTHKMSALVELQMMSGIQRFKCATLPEAEMLAQTGVAHILVAYPLVGPNVGHFLSLMRKYPDSHFYAIADHLQSLSQLNLAAQDFDMGVNVLVDVNTGQNRTGVRLEDLISFVDGFKDFSKLNVCGFHCYDGHRHEREKSERESAVQAFLTDFHNALHQCEQSGLSPATSFLYVMGGTPTFACYAHLTSCYLSPGTSLVYDGGYAESYPDLPFRPAAAILSRVISHPAPGKFTLDLGYKAIAADPPGLRGKIINLEHYRFLHQNEEHWVLEMEPGYETQRPDIGKVLYVLPVHICSTTVLYPRVLVVEDGEVIDLWKVTARDHYIVSSIEP